MYKAEFNPKELIENCVDIVRAGTNASIEECHNTLVSVFELVGPFLSSDLFDQLTQQASRFEVNIDTCHDRIRLNKICETLYDIFMEKQELSYSAEQNDEELFRLLQLFGDVTEKADARVTIAVISSNNFDWLIQLLNVLHMDQDPIVRKKLIESLHIIIKKCDDSVKKMLIDTELTIILVNIILNNNTDTKDAQHSALQLLGLMYTSDVPPSLTHSDYINSDFFDFLYRNIEKFSGSHVLQLCENVYYLMLQNGLPSENAIRPLLDDPYSCSKLGIVLINELNLLVNERRLNFLRRILEIDQTVINAIFYDNDLKVLAHVLAREMINHSDQKIRQLCHECLEKMVSAEIVGCDEEITDAMNNFNI